MARPPVGVWGPSDLLLSLLTPCAGGGGKAVLRSQPYRVCTLGRQGRSWLLGPGSHAEWGLSCTGTLLGHQKSLCPGCTQTHKSTLLVVWHLCFLITQGTPAP